MLTACGNKGPLYIPKAEKADVAKEADKKKTRTPGDSTAK
jgi:predicted small lipoprotein YifL